MNLTMNGKYMKRTTAVPLPIFMEEIVKPIMRQVAAKNIKKNLGLVVSAVCGGINFLPYQTTYTGETNPLQTLSSHLSHYKCQPNHLEPDHTPLEEIQINVFPLMNNENGIPNEVINRFVSLCEKYHVEYEIFTRTGGNINLTNDLLKVMAYFASDKGLEVDECIWGSIKPISHINMKLLENKDIPQHIKNKVVGRKRGRPRKNPE